MRNYHDNRTGFARRQREDDEYHVPDPVAKDVPHAVHINGKKWKSFSSQSHAQNVAKKIAGATVHREEVELGEAKDAREYDYEGDMAKSQLRSIIANAQRAHDMLEDDTNMAEWVQSKITLAADYISTVADYMQAEVNEATSAAQQAAIAIDMKKHGKKPKDQVKEAVHRIGLTVTDPNHPMVSKRKETIQMTARVKGEDREKAINGAIAHYKRKGYKVHDHHYLGVVNEAKSTSGVYEKSEENKRSADAAKKQGNMFDHHMHMADYHDNLAQWHAEEGRHNISDIHAEKSEKHHEQAMKLKEETNLETRIWEAWSMGKRDPQKSIKVGHQVRSYDFPGMHDDHYIEGHVVGETPHTYHIRVNKVVRGGKEVPTPAHMNHVEAPKGKGMFSDAYAVHKIVAKQDAVAAKAAPAQGAAKTFASIRGKR